MNKEELYVRAARKGCSLFARNTDEKIFSVKDVADMIIDQYFNFSTKVYKNRVELSYDDIDMVTLLKILNHCKMVRFDYNVSIINNENTCDISIF